jgi:RNA polymerase sigma-70 factor, ECF subfamily
MAATRIVGELARAEGTPPSGLVPELAGLVYENLRRYAQVLGEGRGDRTLTPTALVNEAYLRMVDQSRVEWRGRTHFFAVGAEMVRRVLVDDARRRGTAKRGGGAARVMLTGAEGVAESGGVDVLALDEALGRLAALDPRAARVVELKFFGGLREEDAALILGVSPSTVRDDWRMARAWLRQALTES